MAQNKCIGLFFYVDGEFLLSTCSLHEAEKYGDFLNYPDSHDNIWQMKYATKYMVDFDYFPRGRIVYRISDATYLIYFDNCLIDIIDKIPSVLSLDNYMLCQDEHYQCHNCNEFYCF